MIFKNCTSAIDPQCHQELTGHGSALLPAACYEDDDLNTYPVHWHWHDELEATVVIEGAVRVSVGARQFTIVAGDGLFINAGVLHNAHPIDHDHDKCILHAVVFHPRLVGGSMDSVFWQRYLLPLLENPALDALLLSRHEDWSAKAIQNILNAWDAGSIENIGYEFTMRSELSGLILSVYNHVPAYSSTLSPKILRDNERMKLMLSYIQDNFANEITIDDIAVSASVSKSECLRCFKNIVKVTPIQYLRQYRLQKAAEMLLSSDLKVTNIGVACGFQEMSYFSRVFREMWGCVPSEYRKKNR